jgi:hypothetical protein
LYKRFIKTWICFANPWIILIWFGSFQKIWFADWIRDEVFKTSDLRIQFVMQFSEDLIHGFHLFCSFKKIWIADLICDRNFKRFNESLQILRIFTNLKNIDVVWTNKSWTFGFTNLYVVQKIWLADLICDAVFKRFDSRIRFVIQFSKDSIWGFVS